MTLILGSLPVSFYGKSHRKHLQRIKPCLPRRFQYSIQEGEGVVSSCSGSEFLNISLTLVGGKSWTNLVNMYVYVYTYLLVHMYIESFRTGQELTQKAWI